MVWFLPLLLRYLKVPEPRTAWLDPALLTGVAALVSLFVGSYRVWVKSAKETAACQKRLDDQTPIVRLAPRATFNGGYSSAPKDPSSFTVEIEEVRNPGRNHVYLETPSVHKSALPLRIFGGLGQVRLYGLHDGQRNQELNRAPIPAGESRFDLRVKVETPFCIETREELAGVLKQLTDASVTLRFTFLPECEPIDRETTVDFTSFRSAVLRWWEQEKSTQLLRLYGDS